MSCIYNQLDPSDTKMEIVFSNNKNVYSKKDNNYGLINIGFTCYMNSFLQLLFHCPKFINELKKVLDIVKNKGVTNNLFKIIENPNSKNNLINFKSSLRNISVEYSKYIQNDSQKFGMDLLNEIINEIKDENSSYLTTESQDETNSNCKINPTKEYMCFLNKYQNNLVPIEEMFLINEYKISKRKFENEKILFEKDLDIKLHFPKKISSYYSFSLKELLDFKYHNMNFSNNIKICKFPDILIITIIRAELGEKFKSYKVNYPNILQLKDYADTNITKFEKYEYILLGVNKKKGYSREHGHYYCEIKIGNIWYKFDDSIVTKDIPFRNSSNEVVGLFYVKKH
jgi:ubiquitin C-terminal hydrolase